MSGENIKDGERLAVLETKVTTLTDTTDRIERNTEKLSDKIETLVTKIDDNFVKHSEVAALEEDIDKRFKTIDDRLGKAIEAKSTEKWVMRILLTISAIVNIVGVYELFN